MSKRNVAANRKGNGSLYERHGAFHFRYYITVDGKKVRRSELLHTKDDVYKFRSCDAVNELADAIRSRLKTERSEAEWEPQPFLFDDVDEFWHSAYLPCIQAKKKPRTVSG